MVTYTAEIAWTLREGDDFQRGRYSRVHAVRFDGGLVLPASASPHEVGAFADANAADPEEMLVAALSSCHMLTFLHAAREAGFVATSYSDRAEGTMTEIAPGRRAVTRVVLRPRAEWMGVAPDAATLDRLHHAAHERCFIANSVKTEVVVAPAD